MASNPMQRKARNSFLLGMLLMLVILGAVIALLIMQLMKNKDSLEKLQAKTVYVASSNISSGDKVTMDDFEMVLVSADLVPTNTLTSTTFDNVQEGYEVTAKINISAGQVISTDMLNATGEEQDNTVRKQEYNMIVLPTDLEPGQYVDIRLLLPSGQDYIVVSKKQVEIPQINGVYSADTIWMEMSEGETLLMSNAIVEAYMISGSKLYATVYTEAGLQEAAKTTYPINSEVAQLMENNDNLVEEAKNAIRARYKQDLREDYINSQIAAQEDATGNVETGMEESITNSQTAREEYLESLAGGSTTTTTTTTTSE